MLELCGAVLLFFSAPIALFCLFWKFKKPLWSNAVYFPLLLYSIIKNVFWYGEYRGFWQEIKLFMGNDSVMMFYFWWLPSIIGFVLIHIIYFISKKRGSKKPDLWEIGVDRDDLTRGRFAVFR